MWSYSIGSSTLKKEDFPFRKFPLLLGSQVQLPASSRGLRVLTSWTKDLSLIVCFFSPDNLPILSGDPYLSPVSFALGLSIQAFGSGVLWRLPFPALSICPSTEVSAAVVDFYFTLVRFRLSLFFHLPFVLCLEVASMILATWIYFCSFLYLHLGLPLID